MTTGTLDWSNPLPGGARQVLNAHPNLGNTGGTYTSPWFDVTVFSGLLFEWQNFGLVGDFGYFNMDFSDALNTSIIKPTFFGTWRGDLQGAINIPVLGSQARLTVSGPAHVVQADVTVTGHGNGPGTDVALSSQVMAKISTGALGAGAGISQISQIIREGAAQLHIETGTQPGNISVTAFDNNGLGTNVGGFTVVAGQNDTRRIWRPPMPVQLNLANTGAGVGAFNAILTAERS